MSLPSPDNDYAAPPDMPLNKAAWDAAMTSIGARLRAREALEATFQGLIDLGVDLAVIAVQSAIAPKAAEAQAGAAQIADLLAAIMANAVPTNLIATSAAARFVSDAEINALIAGLSNHEASILSLIAYVNGSLGALALKAPLASPAFTGWPTTTTPAPGSNSKQVANAEFVRTEIAALVETAPAALDTLNELAAALGDDPNFAATMTAALAARLRVDAAQALTALQKTQGRANLDLGSLATKNAVTPADLPAGPWVFLSELVASSSATLEDATHLTADYDEYEFVFIDLRPAANASQLRAFFYASGAWQSAGYSSLTNLTNGAGTFNSLLTNCLDLSGGARLKNSGGVYLNGRINLHSPGNALCKRIYGQTAFGDDLAGGGSAIANISASWNAGVAPVTGIRFAMDSGNIADGRIRIYGRKK